MIVIVGVIQGMVIAFVLGFQSSNSSGKKLLSAILLTLALLTIKILLDIFGLYKYPVFQYLPVAIDTLLQPLVYLYVCSLTEDNFTFNRNKLWHFLPVLLFQMHAAITYSVTLIEPNFHLKYVIAEHYLFYNRIKGIEKIVAFFSIAIYWYLSFRKTLNYSQRLSVSRRAIRYSNLIWLRNLLIGTGILGAILFLSSVVPTILGLVDSFGNVKVFYGYLSVLTYFFSIRGYQMILPSEVKVARLPEDTLTKQMESNDFADTSEPIIEVERDYSDILSALNKAMEEQLLFLEPELSLKKMAKTIGYPTGQVSAAINAGFGLNFRTWVNGYRVAEVKKRLAHSAYKHLSLTGIAFECGFNSEASFYRIFRQCTGYSPKSYLQEIKREY
ncbi:helix-turn-helix domain-containing protein [Chitinophaga sp. 22321]|uniref:Helix-turn-helix transcriptional regulator n=1 Tax=Chitinophaga hostae TaxID=2831022 RepID=A0ABS5IWD0_9BACT|nr:AraC family transcriptional regulator [Chitinophaga hostae]MBS0027274.1 helix-turn-helix transcriptional regulator [Chitinophaga hostae]